MKITIPKPLIAGLLIALSGMSAPSPALAGGPKVGASEMGAILAPWREKLEKSRRDVVLIQLAKGADKLRMSKVGGKPYLPKGQSLPKSSDGKDMFLLAQVNFAEVPATANFPSEGILQFFINSDDVFGAGFGGPGGTMDLMSQKNFRILFHPNVTSEPADFVYPPKDAGDTLLPIDPKIAAKMTFRKTTETVSSQDFEFSQILGMEFHDWVEALEKKHGIVDRLKADAFEDAVTEAMGAHEFTDKLGGYPSFTQEDPRPAGSPLRLLFQLDSQTHHGVNVMWGDAGIAGFFIDPADLAKKDFSKVMYSWDCS